MPSLYELTSDYLQALELTDEEITPEEKAELMEMIYNEIAQKSLNSFYYIRNKETELEAIDNEIKRLKGIKERKERVIDRFKSYVRDCLVTMDKTKLDFGIGSFSLRNSVSTEIDDLDSIPKKFLVKKVEMKPDKKLIKEALQGGKKVKGARLQENVSLQIK